MKTTRLPALATLVLALASGGCATTAADTNAQAGGTTSNPPAGAAAASNAGSRAVGAYGAIGTSDDVRGRTSSSSASQLTGRATMAGSDSGTTQDADDDADADADADADEAPPR